MAVVVVDECEDLSGEFVDGVELAVFEYASLQDREEQLDLVEPRRVRRGVVQEHAGMRVEELLDGRGAVRGEVVDDAVQLEVTWGLRDKVGEELDEVGASGRVGDPSGDGAVVDVEPGEEHGGAVTDVPVVASPPRTSTAGLVGFTRDLAWIWDFSSTDHTTAFSGGFRYNPQTSPAFAQKSGSWLVIHDSVCHGLRSNALQIRHAWDAEIGTPCSAIRAASRSIVHRVAGSGGGSVTVLTNKITSSWS